jgi:hypothetical protein
LFTCVLWIALGMGLGACAVNAPAPAATFPGITLEVIPDQINDVVIEFGGLRAADQVLRAEGL